ncbi:hypothetical protein [Sediminibacterium goheungense]|uniref:Uncharacterized protein n=1 Tax=Sediminibacterium goheungense TaxID=1086393 RepID=A0A4R6IU05_9BACT|nr:hypothetical protein [Sediminibacterium goheungense]TDO25797.1 hypothetical protein BC659_2720 [Sediminibacterium goheungense]
METTPISREPAAIATLFSHDYLNAKALYLYLTGKIPTISFMNGTEPLAADKIEQEEE